MNQPRSCKLDIADRGSGHGYHNGYIDHGSDYQRDVLETAPGQTQKELMHGVLHINPFTTESWLSWVDMMPRRIRRNS